MFSSEDLTVEQQALMTQNVAFAEGMVNDLIRLAHEVHDRTDDMVITYVAASKLLTIMGVAHPEIIPDTPEEAIGPDGRPSVGIGHGMGMLMLINATQQLADLQDAYAALAEEHADLESKLDNAISEVERLSTDREFNDIADMFGTPDEPESGEGTA